MKEEFGANRQKPARAVIDEQVLRLLNQLTANGDCEAGDMTAYQGSIAPELALWVPPLLRTENLLELAEHSLLGYHREREELSALLAGAATPVGSRWQVLADAPAECSCEQTKTERPLPTDAVLPADRVVKLIAAAAQIAPDRATLASYLGAIELSLVQAGPLLHASMLAQAGDGAGALRFLRSLRDAGFDSLTAGQDELVSLSSMGLQSTSAALTFGPLPGGPRPGGPLPGLPFPRTPFPRDLPRVPWWLDRPVRIRPDYVRQFDACMVEIVSAIFRFAADGTRYQVNSIEPQDVCSGSRIVLSGTGFGEATGVTFTTATGSVTVDAFSVTDTQISVDVPREAVSGPVNPFIPVTFLVCGTQTVNVVRRGSSALFRSGHPRVSYFRLTDARTCIVAGERPNLSWVAVPADATVTLSHRPPEDGPGVPPRELVTDGSGFGTVTPDFSRPGTHRFTLRVRHPTSDCPDVTQRLTIEVEAAPTTLAIVGVEATQGIQRFTLPPGDGSRNNSVPLIASKDTVVRVYVQADRAGYAFDRAEISGYVRIRGRHFSPINVVGGARFYGITAGPAPSRANTNDSLNFLIPGGAFTGTETLEVEVFTRHGCAFASDSAELDLTWEEHGDLPLSLRILEESSILPLTRAAALDLIDRIFDYLPCTAAEARVLPGTFVIRPGTTEDNYCRDGGFYQLALSLAYEHNDAEGYAPDPHETIWIGVYNRASGCSPAGMMAWPWTSTCVSSTDADTAAHEICHCLGMGHTVTTAGERCNDLFQPVACHFLPNNGGLGADRFDVRGNRAISGASDLMSYRGGQRFLHPDHWEAVLTAIDSR